ncbi:molybdopterin-dependent oxidoreductase [Seleniivibrio woodruffii]|uniref:Phenylacetyl-CoA:acceptor oxidoreductase PadB subunit n=1 Tax=Seleniivibrio woodruffii TaxID=1078050 RepID=A0A4R1K5Z6_9BACT|nr:molybdopterin-dependent oxidoreductase [Seleniivibrio woodruffii]TCK58469.1 phenylacetyl-CoA:acceptor oxidoreductase PadB subunit [Seleniivibrio woodruffii]TVZ36842.1 anaerobic selenocysteine-containing dehydrogenase [Seleniivibrio woodruffii]
MSNFLLDGKVSRRSVLKAAGLTGAAVMVAQNPFGRAWADDKSPSSGNSGKDEWHFSHCRMCMRGECVNMYRTENGVVVEMKGVKEAPTNKGAMCPRGQSVIQNLYNPYRVKAPMKRTNPKKGLNEDPGWIEISWEEAISITSGKLKAIHDKDPRRLMFNIGFGDMNYFNTFIYHFAASFGTPNLITSNGPLCTVHFATDLVQGVFPVAVSDLVHCKYHITMGRSLGMAFGTANGHARGLTEAVQSGKLKLVDINPRNTPEASRGEWVAIKPGTDLAFLLAMSNSIIFDVRKYDVEFLQWRTNGPYLIDANGNYLRGKNGKPQVFDASDKKVKSFDDKSLKTPDLNAVVDVDGQKFKASFSLLKDHLKQYTPEWAEKITTVPAKTIKRIAKEFVDAASIGSTITLDGVTMPLRPASLVLERGAINQEDGTPADLMSKVVNMLVGNLEVPGGVLACSRGPFLSPDQDGVVQPKFEAKGHEPSYPPQHLDLTEYLIHKHTAPYLAFKAAKNPKLYGLDYEVDALFVVGGNPVTSGTEPQVIADSISSIPFVACVGYHYDEIAMLSDIVFPSNSILEKKSVNVYESDFTGFTHDTLGLCMSMYRDELPPVYNTRQAQEVMMDIAEQIGTLPILYNIINHDGVMLGEVTFSKLPDELKLDPSKKYSIKDIWDRGLKAKFGMDKGIDMLKKQGIYYYYEPKSRCYNSAMFKKGETRHPIYFERLIRSREKLEKLFVDNHVQLPEWDMEKHLRIYEPMPTWRPNNVNSVKKGQEYDLIAYNYKITYAPFKIGAVDQLPWLNEVGETFFPFYNTICMNPLTAKAKGFKDGDIITVESANGKVQGKLKTSELFHPETVAIGGSLGRMVKSLGKKPASYVHFNKLTNGKLNNIDSIGGGIIGSVPVKVYH